MMMSLIESYQVGKSEYHRLLNTLIDAMGNYKSAEIKDALLNEGELGSLEIKQVINKEDNQTVEDAKTILLDENLMFEEYIETVDIGELNRDHLLEIGKKICLERGETELL